MKTTVVCLASLLLVGAAVSSANAGCHKFCCCGYRLLHPFAHGSYAPSDVPNNYPPPPNPLPFGMPQYPPNGNGNGDGTVGFPFPMHQFARSPRDYFMLDN